MREREEGGRVGVGRRDGGEETRKEIIDTCAGGDGKCRRDRHNCRRSHSSPPGLFVVIAGSMLPVSDTAKQTGMSVLTK